MNININKIIKNSWANGPGKRYTIWTQGCDIGCPGCSNKDTWDDTVFDPVDVNEIIDEILKSDVDGVTFTGGEPLQQYSKVLEICKKVFKEKSVFLLSGYSFSKIEKDFAGILNHVDILVSEPFNQKLIIDTFQYGGSTNQITHYLTDRGKDIEKLGNNPKEIRISKDSNTVIMTGFLANK